MLDSSRSGRNVTYMNTLACNGLAELGEVI